MDLVAPRHVGSSQIRNQTRVSCIGRKKVEMLVAQSCPTLCYPLVAFQVPLSMEFSRQEHWSGLPFPFPEDLPDPGIKPRSPTLKADSLPSEYQGNLTVLFLKIIFFLSVQCKRLTVSTSFFFCATVAFPTAFIFVVSFDFVRTFDTPSFLCIRHHDLRRAGVPKGDLGLCLCFQNPGTLWPSCHHMCCECLLTFSLDSFLLSEHTHKGGVFGICGCHK